MKKFHSLYFSIVSANRYPSHIQIHCRIYNTPLLIYFHCGIQLSKTGDVMQFMGPYRCKRSVSFFHKQKNALLNVWSKAINKLVNSNFDFDGYNFNDEFSFFSFHFKWSPQSPHVILKYYNNKIITSFMNVINNT